MASYTFIPNSPTKYAWDTRLIKEKLTLKQIPVVLKERCYYQSGFVSIPWPPNRELFPKGQYLVFGTGTEPDPTYQVKFSGPRELEEILGKLQWNEDALHRINVSKYGYFLR